MQQLVNLTEDTFQCRDAAVCNAAVAEGPTQNCATQHHTDLNYVTIITQEPPQHNPVGFGRSAGGTWRQEALVLIS